MDSAFWLGIAVAVPLGIITNMLTPVLQRLLATRSDAVRTKLDQRRQADVRMAAKLSANLEYFRSWQLRHQAEALAMQTLVLVLGVLYSLCTVLFYVEENAVWFIGALPAGMAGVFSFIIMTNNRRRCSVVERLVFKEQGWFTWH